MKYTNSFVGVILAICLLACKEVKQNHSIVINDTAVSSEKPSKQLIFKTPEIPDTVYFAGEIIPLKDIDLRERYDRELVVNNFWHSTTIFYLKRAGRWFPIIKQILAEEQLPEDFIYLAVIESGLIREATSPSGAKGIWQFLKGTAIDYGLEVNHQVDERMHAVKSTKAACQYLKKAYKKFGTWTLAAAAYNRGSGGINSDLNSQQVNSFFDLHLNPETSRYVFRILAVKAIMENPQFYGFDHDPSLNYSPYETKSVVVNETINDLVTWSLEQGINYKILKRLNPWILTKSLIATDKKTYEILLPKSSEHLAPFNG